MVLVRVAKNVGDVMQEISTSFGTSSPTHWSLVVHVNTASVFDLCQDEAHVIFERTFAMTLETRQSRRLTRPDESKS